MFYVKKKHMTYYVISCEYTTVLCCHFSNEKDAIKFATKLNNKYKQTNTGHKFVTDHISNCDCEHPHN